MHELLRLQTTDFELTVWCSDSSARLKSHEATITKRCLTDAEQTPARPTSVRFQPPLDLQQIYVAQQSVGLPTGSTNEIATREPLFFENMLYQFEWIFFGDTGNVEKARLTHRSRMLNDGFRFSAAHNSLPARLTGTVNTGNDVGWMRVPLEYTRAGHTHKSDIAIEVYPTKMDLQTDLPAMYQSIDKDFPLWRFSLVEKTEQNVSRSHHRGYFPLLWLASFKSLRERLEKGLNVIAQAPHNRLQPEVLFLKADRIKGKLSHQLATKVREGINDGRHEQRYRLEKKRLSVDTPENRFIRMVVVKCGNRLAEFETKLRTSNQVPDRQRLSDAFLNELHSWQKPLRKMQHQSFLKDVGDYQGLIAESQVLQQKTGYSSVYRLWQELKYYLDLFANQSEVSMKSVAEIYEVWCFLEIRKILINQLGFTDVSSANRELKANNFYEYQLKDGFAGAFEFIREDGVKARLAHEPVFRKAGADIRTYLVTQKPDIVLEVQIQEPFAKRFIWVFDAKYRIKTEQDPYDETAINDEDLVPDDAINQMHRYRDALIRITNDRFGSPDDKSRPVVGAYALYPGYFEQQITANPYSSGINETGIGAFAMLPASDGNRGSLWLTEFLTEQIGIISKTPVRYGTGQLEENLYVKESARIPYYGMKQVFYPDLTLTAVLGEKTDRHHEYFQAFLAGTAGWYHTPVKTFLDKYKQHIVKEIRFLALATQSASDGKSADIERLWPVKSVVALPRHHISAEQSGKESDSADPYYLFELGNPLKLEKVIHGVPHSPFRNSMKLTRLALLDNACSFIDLAVVYADAIS